MPIEPNPYALQVRLLLELLPYVATETDFALKGGSAINLFIRDMPRLSVDIDLVYLPLHERDTSLQQIGMAFSRLADKIEASLRGSRVKRLRQGAAASITKLVVQKAACSIKIEVSPVSRGCVHQPFVQAVQPSVEQQFGYAEMLVEHHDDIYAGKLCAALDRQHPRDLFDVHFLLTNEGITPALKDTFLIYLISSNRPIAELLAPNRLDIKAVYATEFVGMTNTPISLEQLLAAREHMIATLHHLLTDQDREFLLSVKRGKPDWGLCALPNAANLPAVRWKLHNLAAMKPAQHKQALAKLERVLAAP